MNYKIVSDSDALYLANKINTLAKEGWRVVSVYATSVPGVIVHYACLSKEEPKQEKKKKLKENA